MFIKTRLKFTYWLLTNAKLHIFLQLKREHRDVTQLIRSKFYLPVFPNTCMSIHRSQWCGGKAGDQSVLVHLHTLYKTDEVIIAVKGNSVICSVKTGQPRECRDEGGDHIVLDPISSSFSMDETGKTSSSMSSPADKSASMKIESI